MDGTAVAELMISLGSPRWPPPDHHADLIRRELTGDGARRDHDIDQMVSVIARMPSVEAPDLSSIDWDAELAPFSGLEFPAWYRQPFHSVPGGWLSEAAAANDRAAMQAIYADAHPEACLGLRRELAAFVPDDAAVVVDLGSGTGDGAAAVAARLPHAWVIGVEASPFMHVAARALHGAVENLELVRGWGHHTGLPDGSADAVTITLVLHECPDTVKHELLAEAHRLLGPDGTLVLTDTATDDLDANRGFYEPYRLQWREFDPDAALTAAGFTVTGAATPAPTVWTRLATT